MEIEEVTHIEVLLCLQKLNHVCFLPNRVGISPRALLGLPLWVLYYVFGRIGYLIGCLAIRIFWYRVLLRHVGLIFLVLLVV